MSMEPAAREPPSSPPAKKKAAPALTPASDVRCFSLPASSAPAAAKKKAVKKTAVDRSTERAAPSTNLRPSKFRMSMKFSNLDGLMGDDWLGQGYGGEDSDDDFDRGYTVEGVIEPHMIDDSLQGEEDRQFRSKVWEEFTKIRVAGVVTKGQCMHCNKEISAKRGAGTSAMLTHLKRCKERLVSDFRSRLAPKTVEVLMCSQDWFRAAGTTKFSMESIDRGLLDESNEYV